MFSKREDLYAYVQDVVLEGQAIDFLEFGVFEGASLRVWSTLNSNAQSRFFGFDTFTGLPEPWDHFTATTRENHFDRGGRPPDTWDARVSFVKGLFQQTLPEFLQGFVARNQLVVHNDSDLYSATLYVLAKLDVTMKPGTVLLFDEFSSILHEFRALEDYCSSHMRSYEVLGATCSSTDYYTQLAIRMV